MFEVTLLIMAILLIAVSAFFPTGYNLLFSQRADAACDSCPDPNSELSISEDPAPRPHFLTHLQNEIESALFPRPTDSILKRHYDALVSAELENRLAAMPDS